ncbi:MAG: L-threonylcarbamoyladenylate synthase [Armatimonadetes bacterium]|nr:L-threonylcarbamoyladenylate synthase [Armatimonadota bacterium]
MTQVWQTSPDKPDETIISAAADVLKGGGLVAFPTETVYGLGAILTHQGAIERIFRVKNRPPSDPLIVHLADPDQARDWAQDLPKSYFVLSQQFLPGPLTLVVKKRERVPDIVTAGRDTVALRVPSHPVARALLRETAVPVAAPSANLFGRPSPTTADHVLADLRGKIEGLIDAGPTPCGVESTVLDITQSPPVLLRPGGVPKERLEEVLGVPILFSFTPSPDEAAAKRAPGRFLRHYAPSIPVLLSDGTADALIQIALAAQVSGEADKPVGLLVPDDWAATIKEAFRSSRRPPILYHWGQWGDWEEMAKRLFQGLRWLERQGVSAIVAPLPNEDGMGLALRDRLLRASARPSSPPSADWGP